MYYVVVVQTATDFGNGTEPAWIALQNVLTEFLRGQSLGCQGFGQETRTLKSPAELPKLPWNWGGYKSKTEWFAHGSARGETESAPAYVWTWPSGTRATDARCRWFADHFEWSLIRWFNTYSEKAIAFVTASTALFDLFQARWRAHPGTTDWDNLATDDQQPILLGAYAVRDPLETYRTVLFSEGEDDGATVWNVCNCANESPLLCLFGCDTMWWNRLNPAEFELVAGPRYFEFPYPMKPRGAGCIVRPRSAQDLFACARDNLIEEGGDSFWRDNDLHWALFGGNADLLTLTSITPLRCFYYMRSIADVLQYAQWIYCQHHGGGPEEYYNVFAARDPRLTGRIIRTIEDSPKKYYGVSGVF